MIANRISANSNNTTVAITSALCAITAVSATVALYGYYFGIFNTTSNNKSNATSTSSSNCSNNESCCSSNNETIVTISLPEWLYRYKESLINVNYTTDEEMMKVAIDISAKNIEYGTGGPFGCAIFERTTTTQQSNSTGETIVTVTTKLLSVGANRVVALNNSTLHGEMVAIQFAQSKLQSYSLRNSSTSNNSTNDDNENSYYILVTSCEPCCMCLGGIMWSGVNEVICGATKADAETIGFYEGPVFEESYKQLQTNANIIVKRSVLQHEAATVLQHYGTIGVIYNA